MNWIKAALTFKKGQILLLLLSIVAEIEKQLLLLLD